jgi:hypothetical protein
MSATKTSYPDTVWQWYNDGLRLYTEGMQAFWSALPAWPEIGQWPRTPAYKGACGDSCRDSCCDPCACERVDAAMVVRARLGERRIVPVVVTNHWRRKRQVTVSLSDWTSCHGDCGVRVVGRVHPSGELTLEPCERRELIVEVTATPDDSGDSDGSQDSGEEKNESRSRFEPDVRVCATFRADLRVDGCSTAPIRLALQVLPRSCGALAAECDCGCCGTGGCAG